MAEPTLFDEASLALIASGGAGKDGKVYSVKPVPVYGPELVTNGDFATDSDWTKTSGVTISGGKANFTNAVTNTEFLQQAITAPTGVQYRIQFEVSNLAAGDSIKVRFPFQDTTINSNGLHTLYGDGIHADFLRITPNSSTGTFSIDNVSVKKVLSGDGDFTFSRGSNLAATRVGADGLIEKGRENLLLQSNQFDTTWGNTNITITGGQSDRDGGSNAWKFDINAGTAAQNVRQGVSNSGVTTFSLYLKAGTLNWSLVQVLDGGSNPAAYFDLQNGAVGNITGGAINASIEAAGNGYYRCSVQANGNITQARIYPATADNNITQSSGSIYIQDAQLEIGLAATDYIESGATTGKAGILEDTPRFDYSGGATCPSLLLEPSRSNDIPQSEYIKAIGSLQNMTLLNNASVNPQGLQYATEAVPTGNNATHIFFKSGMGNAANTFTQSIYAKANGYNFCFIRFDLPTTHAWFDLENGVVGQTQAGMTSTIEDAGNGWYRCTATLTTTQYANAVIGVSNQDGITGFAANGTSSVLFWGWQSELGSYPTSYIPTYGVSQTRAGEVCGGAGDASTFNSTEGVLYAEIAALTDDQSSRTITLTDGTFDERVLISYYTGGSNQIRVFIKSGGTFYAVITTTLTDITDFNKIAYRYKSGETKLFINGSLIGTSADTFSITGLNVLQFANGDGLSNLLQGKAKQVLVFKEALSDTELIKLTTI